MSRQLQTTFLAIYLAAFFAFVLGFQKSSGIFFIYFQNSFNASVSEVSLVYSLTSSMMYLGGPFYGAFYKYSGARVSLLTSTVFIFSSFIGTFLAESYSCWIVFYSIVNGIGIGLGHIAAFSIVAETFSKSRSFVNNAMVSCASATAMVSASLFQSLMSYYTWREIMLFTGGVALNGLPISWMVSRQVHGVKKTMSVEVIADKADNTNNCETCKKLSKLQEVLKELSNVFEVKLLKNVWFIIFCFACIGLRGWRHLQTQYFVRYAEYIGIDKQSAALLLTIKLALTLVASLVMGFVTSADRNLCFIKIPRTSTIVIAMAWTLAIINGIPIVWQGYYGYLAYAVLCGIVDGCIGTLPMTLISVFFGKDKIAGALGFRSFITGTFNMAIPPLTGYLIELTGSYKPVLYVCALMSFGGGCTLLLVQCNIHYKTSNAQQNS